MRGQDVLYCKGSRGRGHLDGHRTAIQKEGTDTLVKRYAIYYGSGNLDKLSTYDLVVLQAENYTSRELKHLTDHQTRVLAYLSIGEQPTGDLAAIWSLRDDTTGAVVENPRWGTSIIDCRAPGWHDFILRQRIPGLLHRGATGLFLDTIDAQEAYPAIRSGVIALLHAIRDEFASELWTNRGFGILDTVLAVSDGIVFESFTSYYDGQQYHEWDGADLAWTAQMALRLAETRGQRPVLALDYAEPTNAQMQRRAVRRAQAYGLLSFVTTYDLTWLP
jgi:polysaccharide biosynthesis protein PelA